MSILKLVSIGCLIFPTLLVLPSAVAQTPPLSQNSASEVTPNQILRSDWVDNEAELQLALNAEKTTQSPAILAYARLVVIDANALREILLPAMKQRALEVAPEMVTQQENRVSAKSGFDFGRAYLAAEIVHLQDDIKRFRSDQSFADSNVRQFAKKALPLVEQHLALAEAVRSWLSVGRPEGMSAQ